MSGFFPLAIFSFTRYIPTSWIFSCAGFSAVVQCEQYRGIQSWGFLQLVCPGKLLVFHRPNFSEVLMLSACTEVYIGIFLSLLTCLYQGIPKALGRNAFHMQEMSHEFFFWLLLFSSLDEEVFLVFIPCSLTGLLRWPYFLVVCEERNTNAKVI